MTTSNAIIQVLRLYCNYAKFHILVTILSVTVILVGLLVAIMHVTVSVAIMQLEVIAALMQ